MVGAFTYPDLAIFNKLKIEGAEYLKDLPRKNVLFVSNHQPYFADVITFLHVFCAAKWRKRNKPGIPCYSLNPSTNIYFVAAEETINGSLISRLFKLAGALSIKRTWRADGKNIQRERDGTDTSKINEALNKSWIITFPQGTTKPFAPGRKGTAYIIKHNRPVVVPVVINGFWRAFNKKGSQLSVRFKKPLDIDYAQPAETILGQVMDAIEQSKACMMKGRHNLMAAMDK